MKKYKNLIRIKNDSGCCQGKPFVILYGKLNEEDINDETTYFTVTKEEEYLVVKHFKDMHMFILDTNNCHTYENNNITEILNNILKEESKKDYPFKL